MEVTTWRPVWSCALFAGASNLKKHQHGGCFNERRTYWAVERNTKGEVSAKAFAVAARARSPEVGERRMAVGLIISMPYVDATIDEGASSSRDDGAWRDLDLPSNRYCTYPS